MSAGLGGLFRRLSAPAHALFSAAHVDLASTSAPTNGDVVTWNAASMRWIPQALPAGGGDLTLFDDQVLGSAVNSVTVSSIPATAKHLFVNFDAAYSSTGGHFLRMVFNGITTSTYDQQFAGLAATNINTNPQNNAAYIELGSIPSTSDPAGSSLAGYVFIPNYAATVFLKRAHYEASEYYGGSLILNWGFGGLQGSAGTAISSLTFKSSSGNLKIGSRFTTYLLH